MAKWAKRTKTRSIARPRQDTRECSEVFVNVLKNNCIIQCIITKSVSYVSGGRKTDGWCLLVPMRGKSGQQFERFQPKSRSRLSLRCANHVSKLTLPHLPFLCLKNKFRHGSPNVVFFPFLDLHARDIWKEVSVHRELHIRSQCRRTGPLDLYEGKQ